jgi:hypothetical protein
VDFGLAPLQAQLGDIGLADEAEQLAHIIGQKLLGFFIHRIKILV